MREESGRRPGASMVAALLVLGGCLAAPPDVPDAGSGPIDAGPVVQEDTGGPGGKLLWSTQLRAGGDQHVRDIDRGMHGANTPIFAATSRGGDLRWGTHPEWAPPEDWSPTRTSLTLARNTFWVSGHGPATSDAELEARALALDRWQNLHAVGTTTAPIDFGVGTVPAGAFVFKSSLDRYYVWAKPLGSPSTHVSPRAADALRSELPQPLFIGGSLHGTVGFGVRSFEAGVRPDAFVGRFDHDGALVWLWQVGSEEGEAEVTALSVAGDSVVVGGWFSGRVTVPGAPQPPVGPTRSPFLAKLGLDGTLTWWKTLPGVEGTVASLRVTGEGGVVFAGDLRGSLQWGTGTALVVDGAVLATASASGEERWARGLTGATAPHLTLAKDDDVALAAVCGPSADLGRGVIRSSVRAVCVGRYALADAAVRWTRAFAASGEVDPPRITVTEHPEPFGEQLYLVFSATGVVDAPSGDAQAPLTMDGYDTAVVALGR